jgi:hypothetical protein
MLIDVAEHEAMQEKIELFEDVQTSIAQLNAGNGVEHNAAKSAILGRITK